MIGRIEHRSTLSLRLHYKNQREFNFLKKEINVILQITNSENIFSNSRNL